MLGYAILLHLMCMTCFLSFSLLPTCTTWCKQYRILGCYPEEGTAELELSKEATGRDRAYVCASQKHGCFHSAAAHRFRTFWSGRDVHLSGRNRRLTLYCYWKWCNPRYVTMKEHFCSIAPIAFTILPHYLQRQFSLVTVIVGFLFNDNLYP